MQRPGVKLTPSRPSNALMAAYHWPGNVRELENVLERAIVLSNKPVIDEEDLTIDLRRTSKTLAAPKRCRAPLPPRSSIRPPQSGPSITARRATQFDREYLLSLIEQAGGNMTRASQVSGISRRNLYEKLEKVGLSEDLIKKR